MLADHLLADERPQINMTPMVDVVLCLLIFFMAATRLYDWDEDEFRVDVPQVASASPLTAAPEDLEVTILEPGLVELGGRRLDLDALTAELAAAKAGYEDQGVTIRGDADLRYQALAEVLSACDGAGITSVRLPVRPRDAEVP